MFLINHAYLLNINVIHACTYEEFNLVWLIYTFCYTANVSSGTPPPLDLLVNVHLYTYTWQVKVGHWIVFYHVFHKNIKWRDVNKSDC